MKKELFSIPNIIGYLRILMLPVFLFKYYYANTMEEYLVAFIILVAIFLSDALDGYIARKYNMITNFGKILDPIADKLVQGVLALAVLSKHSLMLAFLCIFICKEIYMAVMGLYLLNIKKSLNGAQWYGKVCTTIVDVCILILLFIPNLGQNISDVMILVMIMIEIFTLVMYLGFHINILTAKRKISE